MPTEQESDLLSLREMLQRRSVSFGAFKLASGQSSDVYIDAKLTTLSARAMPVVGRAFIRRMQAIGWSPEAVGGLTTGADPIAFAVARESLALGSAIDAFIVRKEPKKHGKGKYIEGLDRTDGVRVVIIDDVCTTGGSTATAIEQAQAAGMSIIGAICLVDREMGAAELLMQKFAYKLESIFKLSDLRTPNEPCSTPEPIGASL